MEDERLSKVNSEKEAALKQSNDFYNNLLADNEKIYQQKNDYANQWETTQSNILDKQLAYQTDIINQQKEEARKTKETEAKSALNDYTAYVNPYGYQAERIADNGLSNAGVSETSKLGAYTTYQNRLASANKAMQDAFVSFDNDINAAILNNDVAKAQNALDRLQMQIDFADNYYGNKATYGQNQLSNNQALQSEYFNQYNTVYNQIQDEKARDESVRQWEAEMAEKQRQYDLDLAWQREQAAQNQANWEKEYALSQQSLANSSSSRSSSSSSSSYGGYSLSNGSDDLGSLDAGSKSSNGLTIINNPYTGTINPDAKNGVFNTGDGSGYQPNNIGGSKLSKTGFKVKDVYANTAFGSTGISLGDQSIWKTNNGYYVWDGSLNDYIDVTSVVSKWEKKQNYSVKW